jgi:hypothetical protein
VGGEGVTEYFRVKNWEKFQHYKHRRPPWIKLHEALLDDYDFTRLDDTEKAHLMMIWLIAGNMDNKIPLDIEWLRRKIGATCEINADKLLADGWIELLPETKLSVATHKHSASTMLARCKQSAMPETETETETETERERNFCPETKTDSSRGLKIFEPSILDFPCDGKEKTWSLTESQVSEWSGLFPSLNIINQSRLALAWVTASPERRKTSKGMPRFLVGWFTRSQNNGHANGNGKPTECFRDKGVHKAEEEEDLPF